LTEIQWNTPQWGIDCMDKDKGMPSIPDKTFQLGYTDPLWGVDLDKKLEVGRLFYGNRTLKPQKQKKLYKDKFDPEWNLLWFNQLDRVCECIILLVSEKHKYWWIRNTEPIGDLTIHWVNGYAGSKIAKHSRKSTYLLYGKFKNKLTHDIIIKQTLKWGFLSKHKWIHPSPKGPELCQKILTDMKPDEIESLFDPFYGTGSFLRAADILKIKWYGFEINPAYKPDFDYLFSQKYLDDFILGGIK